MKRINPLFVSLMLIAVLLMICPSCGKRSTSDQSSKQKKASDWRDENEIYAQTYEALEKAFPGGDGEDDISVDDILKYDKSAKIPYFDFDSNRDEEIQVKAAEALKIVWDGKDVPMFGVHIPSIDGEKNMFKFFESFKCRSLALTLPAACVPRIHQIQGEEYHGLSRIEGITTLVVDTENLTISEMDNAEPCTSITDLTIPGTLVPVDVGRYFPNTERITLIRTTDDVPNETFDSGIERSRVSEVTFCEKDGSDIEPSIETIEFFERMKNLPQIKKINGVDKADFEPPMTEELKAEYDKKVTEEKNAGISAGMTAHAKEYQQKYATKNEEGTPVLGNKIIALVDNDCSADSALAGEDFNGIPNDRLAKSVEEADTLLFVYEYHELVGSYSNGGGSANKTYTMVITIDKKNGDKRAAHVVGVTDPPESIKIVNGMPFGASGEFLVDEALAYVKTLL